MLRLQALLLIVLALPASAQSCGQPGPASLGTVTLLANCPSPNPPSTSCFQLLVECTGIPSIEARVRVQEPPPGVPLRGTVVFGVGGGGVGFYGQQTGGAPIINALRDAGFRIVDRSWSRSWWGDQVGVRNQSCRYATLLGWIHANLHTTGVFCASGNSAGGAEIAFALTTWGAGALLDCAVPTGGPPMTRIDLICQDPIPASWSQLCASLVPTSVLDCGTLVCTVPLNHPVCGSCSPNATAADLHSDSILHPGAVVSFPTTRVHQILGTNDCTNATAEGILFHQAVTTEKVLEFADGAPHLVPGTASGQEAIIRALLSAGGCSSGPSTLHWTTPATLGGTLELELRGSPGDPWALALSETTVRTEVLPFGWLYLDSPQLLATGTLDALSGVGTLTIPIPSNPAVIGLEAWLQAMLGSCLSNALRVEVY